MAAPEEKVPRGHGTGAPPLAQKKPGGQEQSTRSASVFGVSGQGSPPKNELSTPKAQLERFIHAVATAAAAPAALQAPFCSPVAHVPVGVPKLTN